MFILENRGKYVVVSMRQDNSFVVMFSNNVPVAMRVGTGEDENDAVLLRDDKDRKNSPMTEKHLMKFVDRFQLAGMQVPLWAEEFDKSFRQYMTTFRMDMI